MCKDRYYFGGALPTNYRTASAYVDLDVAKSLSHKYCLATSLVLHLKL